MNKEIVNHNLVKEDISQEECFSIDKKYFSKIINLAQDFAEIEYRPNRQMLVTGFPRARFYFIKTKNIIFNFSQGELKILAKNLDNSDVIFPLHQKSNRKDSFSVDGRMIERVLKNLPSGEIKVGFIEREEKDSPHVIHDYLQIKNKKFTADFRAKPHVLNDENLVLPEKEGSFTINSADFLNASQKVILSGYEEKDFYKNPDRIRFGLRFQIEENQLTLTTTDGYRLSQKKIEAKGDSGKNDTFLVPKHTVLNLMKFLERDKKKNYPLKVVVDDVQKKVFFSHPDFRMRTPLINTKYPEIGPILEQEIRTKIKIEKGELFQALKKASSIDSSKYNLVTISIDCRNDHISVREENLDSRFKGRSFVETWAFEIDSKQSIETIYLNRKFVLDFIRSIKSRILSIEIADPSKPILFKPSGYEFIAPHYDDRDYIHMIMPIKIH